MEEVGKNITIGDFSIAFYGISIAIGMLLAIVLATTIAKKIGHNQDICYDVAIIAIPSAIVGARLYYVAFQWEYYKQDLLRIFDIREGGLAIYGGVLGGIATAVVFCKYHKFSLIKLLDFVMPSLLLGQAIGRWGNFTNQEAFGNLITDPNLQFFPYGVYIEHLEEWHQATFFYESMANLTLFILMMIVAHKAKKDGWMLAMYFMGYGCIRFFIEGLRADSLYLIPGVRVSQVLSVILVIIGLGIAWGIRTDRLKAKPYDGIYLMNNASKSEEK
jgi:phosphatidylglycerol:prolipoprotein diacylglycerol transferase